MPSQYSGEVKAQALALLRCGETAMGAADLLGLPERTVSRWAMRWREATDGDDNILADEDTRIALRAGELIHDWLDAAEQLPAEQLLKHGLVLNVLRGTAVDKRIKRQSLGTSNTVQIGQVQIIFSSPGQDIIEGHARAIED